MTKCLKCKSPVRATLWGNQLGWDCSHCRVVWIEDKEAEKNA